MLRWVSVPTVMFALLLALSLPSAAQSASPQEHSSSSSSSGGQQPAAVSQGQPGTQTQSGGQEQSPEQPLAGAVPSLSNAGKVGNTGIFAPSDAEFLSREAQRLKFQDEIANEQHKSGVKGKVKQFAVILQSNNGQIDAELHKVASSGYFAPVTNMDQQQRQEHVAYYKMQRGNIDRHFLDDVIRSTQQAISEFQQAAQSAQNPDVRRFASENLPILQNNLNRAKQLQSEVPGHD